MPEKALWEELLPALFLVSETHILDRTITAVLVKHEGLAIPDPTQTSQVNCIALCVVTRHLVMVLRGRIKYKSREHAQLLIDVCSDIRRQKAHGPEEALTAMVGGIFPEECCCLCCGQKICACLSYAIYG